MFLTLQKILMLLEPRARRRLYILLGFIALTGLTDMVGVAAFLPFLAVVADPTIVERNALLGMLHDYIQAETITGFLFYLGLMVVAAIALSLLIKVSTLYAIARFSLTQKYHLSARLMSGYLRQPYVWFLGQHSSNLSKRVLSETDMVVGSTVLPVMRILTHTVSLLFLIAFLITVEPRVALISAAVLIGTYLVIYLFVRNILLRIGQTHFDANTERFKIANETFGGIKEVKLGSLEDISVSRFKIPSWRISRAQITEQVVSEVPRYALETVAFCGMLILILALLSEGEGSVADVLPVLALFGVAGLRMLPAIQQIYHSLGMLRASTIVLNAVVDDLLMVANAQPTAHDAPSIQARRDTAPLRVAQSIEMRDVHFKYPTAEKKALKGLSMEIQAKTTVGIVGGTGAGKTTAVDLVLGLLEPQFGAVLVDGVPLDAANTRSWQNNIGYVPQQIFLIDDTIGANIAFGTQTDSRDQAAIERAAKLAELHEFIMNELPDGYDTMVGERGVRLSGGQRQRIGIARALYCDPDVLVFDEATSALDNLTEQAVMDAVHNLGQAKTIIMIAHRLSTVRSCDTIFLFEHGQVAAQGRYDALVEHSDTFRNMARAGT